MEIGVILSISPAASLLPPICYLPGVVSDFITRSLNSKKCISLISHFLTTHKDISSNTCMQVGTVGKTVAPLKSTGVLPLTSGEAGFPPVSCCLKSASVSQSSQTKNQLCYWEALGRGSPGLYFWLCHWPVMWPWASHFTFFCALILLFCKMGITMLTLFCKCFESCRWEVAKPYLVILSVWAKKHLILPLCIQW